MEYHDDAGHIRGPFPTYNHLVEVDPNDARAGFAIRRVYYISNVPAGEVRGHHAHRKLKQLASCPIGACTITLDDGTKREDFRLDDPSKGLVIGPATWREMKDFTPDCVLVVLASEPYDEADYIRDYDEFLAGCNVAA